MPCGKCGWCKFWMRARNIVTSALFGLVIFGCFDRKLEVVGAWLGAALAGTYIAGQIVDDWKRRRNNG